MHEGTTKRRKGRAGKAAMTAERVDGDAGGLLVIAPHE